MTSEFPRWGWREGLAVGLIVLLVAARWLAPIPHLLECSYVLGAYAVGHPGFLVNDFTFGVHHPKTIVFDHLIGWASTVGSITTVIWFGRAICLTAAVAALVRIGRLTGLSVLGASAVVLAWFAFGQSVVGGEQMAMALNPKAIAWPAGLWAIVALLEGRPALAGVGLGIAVALQQSVGASLSLAMVAVLLATRASPRFWLQVVGISAVIALPALLPAVRQFQQPSTDMVAEWRYQVQTSMRVHLDLRYFARQSLAALAMMAALSLVLARRIQSSTLRPLVAIVPAMVALFLFGVVATGVGRFDLLAIYPFRAPPVFIQFIFLLVVVHAFQAGQLGPPNWILTLITAGVFLALPSPIKRLLSADSGFKNSRPPANLVAALEWIRESTPSSATLVVSPVQICTQFTSHRAQIVYADVARLDRLRDWRERLEAHAGGPTDGMTKRALDQAFNHLDEDAIRSLVARYGGDYLVSTGSYPFPSIHRNGDYTIYDLQSIERPAASTVDRPR